MPAIIQLAVPALVLLVGVHGTSQSLCPSCNGTGTVRPVKGSEFTCVRPNAGWRCAFHKCQIKCPTCDGIPPPPVAPKFQTCSQPGERRKPAKMRRRSTSSMGSPRSGPGWNEPRSTRQIDLRSPMRQMKKPTASRAEGEVGEESKQNGRYSSEGKWACPTCTFHNECSRSECKMCSKPRPREARAPPASPTSRSSLLRFPREKRRRSSALRRGNSTRQRRFREGDKVHVVDSDDQAKIGTLEYHFEDDNTWKVSVPGKTHFMYIKEGELKRVSANSAKHPKVSSAAKPAPRSPRSKRTSSPRAPVPAPRTANIKCAICRDEFETDPSKETKWLPCIHVFHKECIDEWFEAGNDTCPVCKHDKNDIYGSIDCENKSGGMRRSGQVERVRHSGNFDQQLNLAQETANLMYEHSQRRDIDEVTRKKRISLINLLKTFHRDYSLEGKAFLFEVILSLPRHGSARRAIAAMVRDSGRGLTRTQRKDWAETILNPML